MIKRYGDDRDTGIIKREMGMIERYGDDRDDKKRYSDDKKRYFLLVLLDGREMSGQTQTEKR